MSKKSYKKLQVLNFIAYVATITVNALANIIPINNITTGEVSAHYPNLFTPAPITFSIWGLIYTLLFIFVIYQMKGLFNKEKEPSELVGKIGYWFIASCIFNMLWIVLWHYKKVGLSVIIMIFLLLSLIKLYLKLQISRKKVSKKDKYFIKMPFSIYLGWISIATIANISAFLVNIDWNGFGLSPLVWTIFVIVIGTILTLLMLWFRNDIYYGFVVLWAFLGIIIERFSQGGNYSKYIIINVIICMLIILVSIIPNLKKYE
ncbi:MAG: tryptophan-rich sensory protein [Clostridiaceae bacterium]